MRQQSWNEFGKLATTSQRRGWNSNRGHSLIGDHFGFHKKMKVKTRKVRDKKRKYVGGIATEVILLGTTLVSDTKVKTKKKVKVKWKKCKLKGKRWVE